MTEARTYMDGYSDGKEWAQADMLRTIKELQASLAWITEYIRAAPPELEEAKKWLLAMDNAAAGASSATEGKMGEALGIAEGCSGSMPTSQPWSKHPNPVHHVNAFPTEHLRDVVEHARVLHARVEAWVTDAQSGVFVTCPVSLSTGASPVEPSESAEHWHSLYIKKCQELHDEKARLGAEIETLELAAIDDAERYAVPPSQAQPPAPSEAAREYMTGYSDGREWAGATNQAQPPAPDCRTCDRQEFCTTHHVYDDCLNGDQYQPAPAVVLWRTE